MESGKFFLLVLAVSSVIEFSLCDTRYYVKLPTNSSDPLSKLFGPNVGTATDEQRKIGSETKLSRPGNSPERPRSNFRLDDETMIRESLKANLERRNSFVESSTFDPDVLNKFLDEYANKIKSTTERNFNFLHKIGKPDLDKYDNERDEMKLQNDRNESNKTSENSINSTIELSVHELNDTIKRNKYFGGNAPNDDRNGWVTLEAIPWSKSKISKWQASSSSQRPWPDVNKVWDKPSGAKPWSSDFPSRPAYINNEPWHEPPKPSRPDYQSGRPPMRPVSSRPSYYDDRFDQNPNQAQKWPPERPSSSWEKFPSMDNYRPNMEIITDDRPSNFPNTWDKYTSGDKYSYNDRDRYTSNFDDRFHQHQEMSNDWHDGLNNYPSKLENYKDKPNFGRPHYQYTPDHPPNHPSSGDGQWVLLSTNRGYSKSRQRSIKIDAVNGHEDPTNSTIRATKQDNDGTVAVMTSKRQVRLTVLPSINGTNTTTSHGGLLEVEKTFKTVDQSRREYEEKRNNQYLGPFIVNNRPIRNTVIGKPANSNSGVLAAIGAGMLPATMAMMIPIMLGRRKRFVTPNDEFYDKNRTTDLFAS